MTIDLVISHYQEDFTKWLSPIADKIQRLFIYDKSPSGCQIATDPTGSIHHHRLPNIGKNLHSYLKHIVAHWEDLGGWTIFSQDDPTDHLAGIPFEDLLKIQGENGSLGSTPWIFTTQDWGLDGRLNWGTFSKVRTKDGGDYQRVKDSGGIVTSPYNIYEWADKYAGVDLRLDYKGYHPGAIYAIPRSLIKTHSISYYEGLLKILESTGVSDSEDAHYLERIWPAIFQNKFVSLKDLKYQSAVAGKKQQETKYKTKGIIYACQPCYGGGNKHSKRIFWSKAVSPTGPYAKMMSVFDDYGCSILPESFNAHWVKALNMRLANQDVTRFVMMHDDIVPEDFWLEKLLAVLDETGADVVSAVIPIKDQRGLTSTAIDDPNDFWEVYRRLTMTEVMRLPITFSYEDLELAGLTPPDSKASLLINSGLWVADFSKPWVREAFFQMHTRIAFRLADPFNGIEEGRILSQEDYQEGMKGEWIHQVMSEDWDFARQLSLLGCKVLATRAVRLSHGMGEFTYPNWDAWGTWTRDEALRCKFDPTWKDIPQVDGFLSEKEGRHLAELAAGKEVMEIGSYCGKSTIWMARTAKEVVAVDTFDGRGTVRPKPCQEEFSKNLRKYGVEEKVRIVIADTKKLVKEQWRFDRKFDMVFVDGAHDYESVKTDVELATHHLRPGGLLVYHDYSFDHPDVVRCINEIVSRGEAIPIGAVESVASLKYAPKNPNTGAANGRHEGSNQAATAAV